MHIGSTIPAENSLSEKLFPPRTRHVQSQNEIGLLSVKAVSGTHTTERNNSLDQGDKQGAHAQR